jgi:hypothetical protein
LETHDLNSLEDFRPHLKSILSRYGVRKFGDTLRRKNTVLFRGQANAEWELSTTLERRSPREFTVERYMSLVSRSVHEIESCTGKNWGVPDRRELQREIQEGQRDSCPYLPNYDFLVYLRHHGFPSPLLDWTASPYVAAYFAYVERSATERVAVYAYVEAPEGGKGWTGDPPLIHVKGPYVSTDARHFSQKAWYTITTQFNEDKNTHTFRPHSSVFEQGATDQDVLIKITMPSSDRIAALKELEDYNINAFTLFQTVDALVSTLALREFDLHDP